MIESLLGSRTRELVLCYLLERGEGYARAIASDQGCALDTVQKQLKRLEQGGIAKSRTLGRTRVYTLNPDYPLALELQALVRRACALARTPARISAEQVDTPRRARFIARRVD